MSYPIIKLGLLLIPLGRYQAISELQSMIRIIFRFIHEESRTILIVDVLNESFYFPVASLWSFCISLLNPNEGANIQEIFLHRSSKLATISQIY